MRLSLAFVAAAAAAIPMLAIAWSTPQEGTTWTVDYGDPTQSGEHTTTITVKYTPTGQAQQEKTFTGKINVTNPGGMGANEKKAAAQAALQADIDAQTPQGAQPLINLSGGGDVMTATPNSQYRGEVKIDKVTTKDEKTENNDKILKPEGTCAGIGVLEVRGDITGLTGTGGGSHYNVVTSASITPIALTGSMTTRDLLREIAEVLSSQTTHVWLDNGAVYVLLADEDVEAIGAGSSDTGLSAITSVIACF